MLALALSTLTAACSPTWEPDAATLAETGQPVLAWSDPKTCETLIVTGPHRRPEGLRASVVTFTPQGRVAGRVVLPKTMWPQTAIVDGPRRRLYLVATLSAPGSTQLRIEARRLGDFALERSFGAAGLVNLDAPRLKDNGSSTGGEAAVAIDARGRLHIAAVSESVGAQTALYAWRLLPDGRIDPGWRAAGAPVSKHEFTNSGELVAAMSVDGQLLVGAGAKLRSQLFRFTHDGQLDPSFGDGGVLKPKAASSAIALAPTAGGGALFAATTRGQQLVTVSGAGVVDTPLAWRLHEERSEFPFAVLPLADGRVVVAARSFDLTAQRASLAVTLWRRDRRLDLRFGRDGLLEVDEPGVNLESTAATLDADGNVLIAGRRTPPRERNEGTLFLLRFAVPPPPPADEPLPPEPAPPTARPALRGVMPAEPPSAAVLPQPLPSTPAAPASEPGIYVYVDAQGVETYVDSLEQVPAKFRKKARRLAP